MNGNNGHKSSSNGSRRKPRKNVTLKQERFCKAYIANGGNGQEAARTAGYSGNDKTLRVVASENLTKPNLRKYLKTLTENADVHVFRRLMSAHEVLARTTFLASGSMQDLLTNGRFDFVKAEKTGALYLLKRLKIRETNRTFRDGTVEETIVYDATLRDKIGSLRDLGLHHNLWTGEIDDPAEVLARVLKMSKAQTPLKSVTKRWSSENAMPVGTASSVGPPAGTIPKSGFGIFGNVTSVENEPVRRSICQTLFRPPSVT